MNKREIRTALVTAGVTAATRLGAVDGARAKQTFPGMSAGLDPRSRRRSTPTAPMPTLHCVTRRYGGLSTRVSVARPRAFTWPISMAPRRWCSATCISH
jgi:hypothetical protein